MATRELVLAFALNYQALIKCTLVQVALPHFSSVPLAVAETDCVATLSSRLARAAAARLPLRVLKPPVALEPVEVRQVWHRRFSTDGVVLFLRELVRDAARSRAHASLR